MKYLQAWNQHVSQFISPPQMIGRCSAEKRSHTWEHVITSYLFTSNIICYLHQMLYTVMWSLNLAGVSKSFLIIAGFTSRSNFLTQWNMARDTQQQKENLLLAEKPCTGLQKRCLAGFSGVPRLLSRASCLRKKTG